jgi:hypothetical protein
VDRDPRDIYISASKARIVNGADVGGAVIGGGVEAFIERFLTYRNNVSSVSSKNLMRTNFENLILNHRNEIERLSDLLMPLELDWSAREKKIDLERSVKNIRQWLQPENKKYQDYLIIVIFNDDEYLFCIPVSRSGWGFITFFAFC